MKNLLVLGCMVLLVKAFGEQCMLARAGAQGALASLEAARDLSRLGEYSQALEMYNNLLSNPRVSQTLQARAYVISQMADLENGMGAYTEGELKAREALRLLEGADETNTILFATAEGTLADALRGEGNYIEEKNVAERAVSLGRRILDPLAPRLAILITALARALDDSGSLNGALELSRQAVDIFNKAGEGSRIELGTAYTNLAAVYVRCGKPRDALAAVNLALAVWKHVLPPDHVLMLYALNAEIASYFKLKAYQQAEELIPKTLALCASGLGPNHPDRVTLLGNAASVYIAEKKYERAEPLLEEAVGLAHRLFPAGHPISRDVLTTYAHLLTKLNRREDAARVRAQSQMLLAFPEQSKFPVLQ